MPHYPLTWRLLFVRKRIVCHFGVLSILRTAVVMGLCGNNYEIAIWGVVSKLGRHFFICNKIMRKPYEYTYHSNRKVRRSRKGKDRHKSPVQQNRMQSKRARFSTSRTVERRYRQCYNIVYKFKSEYRQNQASPRFRLKRYGNSILFRQQIREYSERATFELLEVDFQMGKSDNARDTERRNT